MKPLVRAVTNGFGAGVILVAAGLASAADLAKIDWTKIPATSVSLFYPGQTSLEWAQSAAHKGAAKVRKGGACTTCHDEPGEEKMLGERLVAGGPLEPSPVEGKNGYLPLKVQAAYDERNAYLRFQWPTRNGHAGTEHQYLRFDGQQWQVFGYPKLDLPVRERKEMGLYEDRLAIMLDDGKVSRFAEQGCWLTCHEGSRDMPKQFTKDEVANNPLLKAIGKSDVRKYLPDTRTNPEDWKTGKSVEDIARIKTAGGFLDLIQWRAHRSHPVGMADDGHVLEFRNSDAGKDMFASNADSKTHAPKFMWDVKKTGYKSITVDQLYKADHFLIKDENAVPFDPAAGWKEGDMLPDYVLSAANAAGSAADNKARASWKDGVWTVVIVRPLGLANSDDKALKEGNVYSVGFAVHDDNITTRGHHVSFVRKLGIGVKGDITATRLP